MSDWSEVEGFALAAIHGAFASPVTYLPRSGGAIPIAAVFTDGGGAGFMGEGATVREVSWQVQQSDIAAPTKGDTVNGGNDLPVRMQGAWKVIDVTRRDDVAAWDLVVER